VLGETDRLYIPTDERQLRRIQRGGEELDRQVRSWAQRVVDVLPAGLPTNADEAYLFSLYLSQQRRRNLQMDAYQPSGSILSSLRSYLPVPERAVDRQEIDAIHRIVNTQLESDIDRAAACYCTDNQIPPESEPAIDWRVAIRFMAQSIYNRAAGIDLAKVKTHPRRFELALVARELSSDISEKRKQMFTAFRPAVTG
jgi:hypothetical protein